MKFRVVFNEERNHFYNVEAKTKEEAQSKAEDVYMQGEENKNVKLLDTSSQSNECIDVFEIKEDKK